MGRLDLKSLGDFLGYLLRVAKRHYGVGAIEQRIVDAGKNLGRRSKDTDHCGGTTRHYKVPLVPWKQMPEREPTRSVCIR
jgi:hypothetical protein